MFEDVRIDVRDVDYEWFRNVAAYLDRSRGTYHFPRESAERLGEVDEDTGDFFLIDGQVKARADVIEVDGGRIPVWSVTCAQLKVKPAVKSPA
jgi:hypothetical protein